MKAAIEAISAPLSADAALATAQLADSIVHRQLPPATVLEQAGRLPDIIGWALLDERVSIGTPHTNVVPLRIIQLARQARRRVLQ